MDELGLSLERRMLEVSRARGGSCIALIDGLDELDVKGLDQEEALAWLPTVFPPGVVFLLSCRPKHQLLRALRKRVPRSRRFEYELPPLSKDDLEAFIELRTGPERASILARALDLDEVFRRTGGHPLLLRYFVDEAIEQVAAGTDDGRSELQLGTGWIPDDQQSLMNCIWTELTSGEPNETRILRRRMIEYLCCAREPGLSSGALRRLLERSTGESLEPDDVYDLLSAASGYLREATPGHYLPYHGSLADHVCSQRLGHGRLRERHEELADWLVTHGDVDDRPYWLENVTHHLVAGGDAAEQGLHLAENADLIRARLTSGRGELHGAWIRSQAQRLPKDARSALTARLLGHWSIDGPGYRSLDAEACMQLAEMWKESELDGALHEAKRIFEQLYQRTGAAVALLRKAWVCYQGLDEWQEARAALEECVSRYDSAGNRLEAALARLQLAQILFDSGVDDADPEELLREECLPAFQQLGLDRETALTHETLGVVVDAEGRWEEAQQFYDRAMQTYSSADDRVAIGRVLLNRSIADLFTLGVDAARRTLGRANDCVGLPGAAQLERYLKANTALHAVH